MAVIHVDYVARIPAIRKTCCLSKLTFLTMFLLCFDEGYNVLAEMSALKKQKVFLLEARI